MKKVVAQTELLQSKLLYDSVKARDDAIRKSQLSRFLRQHHHANQWALCLSALQDALEHKINPSDSMICDAINRCGLKGKMEAAKYLYTSYYKRLRRPRPLTAHIAYFIACADSSDFNEAHKQLNKLLERDERLFEMQSKHGLGGESTTKSDTFNSINSSQLASTVAQHDREWQQEKTQECKEMQITNEGQHISKLEKLNEGKPHQPIINDDIVTEYLRAALASTLRKELQIDSNNNNNINNDKNNNTNNYASNWNNKPKEQISNKLTNTFSHSSERSSNGESSATANFARSSSESEHVYMQNPSLHNTQNDNGILQINNSDDVTSSLTDAEVALRTLVKLRRHSLFRPHLPWTPLLLENAMQLAEISGQWQLCLRMLKSAASEQVIIPPEAYDAAIRACYYHSEYKHVVHLMQELIATRVAPDERSVRLACNSAEEVAASDLHDTGAVQHTTSALAVQLFHAMQENGLPLYQQSYESPLRVCAMSGNWQESLRILKAMRRDRRPISSAIYRCVIAARVLNCTSFEEINRYLQLPVVNDGVASEMVYLAAMRACMKIHDWTHFEQINREMKRREMPESFDKMRLLIEAAHVQGKYHSVLMRFARFCNITKYEQGRVQKDKRVRHYSHDFAFSDRLLDMVFDAYEKMKGHRDPMVEVAYRAAIKMKQRNGAAELNETSTGRTPPPEWIFSQSKREQQEPEVYR